MQKELLKFKLKRSLEINPSFFVAFAKFNSFVNRKNLDRIISKNSIVCIEGFPRCANSFSRDAFVKYTGFQKNIATHVHSHSQIQKALELNIPTIVNIRHPKSCITSLRALSVQYQGDRKKPLIFPLEMQLKWYIKFYESIFDLRDKFVVADFSKTISNFVLIIEELNLKFNNRFPIDNIDNEIISKNILKENENKGHLGPNIKRDAIIQKLKIEYEDSNYIELKQQAERLYFNFIS